MKKLIVFSVSAVALVLFLTVSESIPAQAATGATLVTPAKSVSGIEQQILVGDAATMSKAKAGQAAPAPTSDTLLLVAKRSEMMGRLLEQSPEYFIQLAKSNFTAKLSPTLKRAATPSLEYPAGTDKTYTAEVIHFDDFTNEKNSSFEYYLRNGSDRTRVYGKSLEGLISGTRVRVSGYGLNGKLAIERIVSKVDPQIVADDAGVQKTLVLPLYADIWPTAAERLTRQQLQDQFFSSQNKLNQFFAGSSYGKTSFDFTVMDWQKITNEEYETIYGSCHFFDDITSRVLAASGVNLTPYSRLLVIVPNCGGGNGTVGRTKLTVGGTDYRLAIAKTAYSIEPPPS